jgi:hypothetical protein
MTTCPHCGQPMPTARVRREPMQEVMSEASDRAQLAALNRSNLWGHPRHAWQTADASSSDSGSISDDKPRGSR